MKNLVRSSILVAMGIGFIFSACTEQHNPRPHWAQFEQERVASSQPRPHLSESGELLTGAALTGGKSAEENYNLYCANCHGVEGKGDGPGAGEPKPRNFTDLAWQNSVTDERIATVTSQGGPAVGLSPAMAPWGAVLKESEVQALVTYIRDFK